MLRYVISRFLQSLCVIFAVFTLTFFMIRLSKGDPFMGEKVMPPEIRKVMEVQYGLDQPLGVQYVRTLGAYIRGDFLPSMKYSGRWNQDIIGDSFPVSFTIGVMALMIAMALGIPAGMIAAVKRNTWLDYSVMSLAMAGICLPGFVLGPLLLYFFGLKLQWFNVGGWFERTDWVLPALTLGLAYTASFARLTRGGMLEVLNQDYIRTARAKGVPPGRIVIFHALRGGLVPAAAFLGPALAGITTGGVILEKIFTLPGLGQHFVSSVLARDYTLILATCVFYAAILVVANFAADLLVAWLNPRARLS